MSAGVGIADLAPVAAAAPTSLAYSGSTAAPVPAVGWVAICQKTTMPAKISSDSSAARSPSEFLNAAIGSAPLNGEACNVVVGLGGIERLAHHHDGLLRRIGRREPHLLHHAGRVGGEEDVGGHLGIVDIGLELPPAFHLAEDPDCELIPWEGIEVDAV